MHNPLQKIAVKRFSDESSYYLIQWWTETYKLPSNHPLLLELTWEELYLSYISDYYARNPEELEIDKKELGMDEEPTWKGETSEEYERRIKEKLSKVPKVDLSKWQVDVKDKKDEFEEDFEEGLKNEEND